MTAGSAPAARSRVKIPAGVDTGTRVQLSGQGEVGPGGGPAGDLYVEIHVEEHPVFVRHGHDLHCTVTMPMTAAALGTTIELPLLEADLVPEDADAGDLETSDRARHPAGHPVRHRDRDRRTRAYRRCAGSGRGDIVVRVIVETPTRLDERQEELLRELAALRQEETPDGQVRADAEVGLRPAPRRLRPRDEPPVLRPPRPGGDCRPGPP